MSALDPRPTFGTPGYSEAIDAWVGRHTTAADAAANGCDRCECGCKYWVDDECFDCGSQRPTGARS